MSSTHHVLRCLLRRAIPLGLFAAAAVGCGSEFASGEEGDGWDGQGGDHGSGGAGASTTTPSGEGGMGGTATTSTGPGGSGGTTSHTGGGGGSPHAGGAGGSAGAGGSGGGAVSPPACAETPFSTNPPHPVAGVPFTIHMNIAVAGQPWSCIAFTLSCTGGGTATEDPLDPLDCKQPTGCNGSWIANGCGSGPIAIRFAQHVKNMASCACDGISGDGCQWGDDTAVNNGADVRASCDFAIP